jgi:glycosyltransferase involved in cell wall biosynthesis
MKKPLKVFFAFTQNMAVVWYRMVSFVKHMNAAGAEVAHSKFSVYDSDIINWQFEVSNPIIMKQLEMLMSTADITVMGGVRHPMAVALIQAIQKKYKKPVYMEIDDYVCNLPAYNAASNDYKPNNNIEWILLKQMQVCDGMIVSTPSLVNMYGNYNKNIHVVPNGVDVDVWKAVKTPPKTTPVIRIGFAGSPNHTGDIRLIKNAVLRLLEKYGNKIEFYFWGPELDWFKYTKNIILDDILWVTVDKFPQELANRQFDIAVAPLKDNNFNRAKSNLRFLENSMLRIPVVASDIDDYGRTIKTGKTGYLCKTEDEWVDCLSKLIDSEKLRKEIGDNAYKFVTKEYNIKNIAKDYVEILRQGAKRGHNE